MSANGTPAAKAELREAMSRRLAGLDPAEAARSAERAAARVLELPEVSGGRRLLSCLSFGTELDTWPLVETLLAEGRELFVPRADPRDHQLHVHPYPCRLITLEFGLRQPPRGGPEIPREEVATLDAVLVLGLAFDRRGYRLGHGSGYFDRFLAGLAVPAIGLAHPVQLVDRLPTEPHDVPMTAVVTAEEVVRPAGGGVPFPPSGWEGDRGDAGGNQ